MPLTDKGSEIMSAMKAEYGAEKGERVFYASKNAGEISGVDRADELSPLADRAAALRQRADGVAAVADEAVRAVAADAWSEEAREAAAAARRGGGADHHAKGNEAFKLAEKHKAAGNHKEANQLFATAQKHWKQHEAAR